MVLDFSGAKRLEMECQILTMALRQSWSSRDPVGTVNAAGILNEIFPDLVSEYSSNPNPSDFYRFLELNPDAGPMVIRKAYHYAVRRFLRENKGSALRRKRAEFFQVLDAGIVMRKSRLRLSHDLAVLRAQLIANRIIAPDGVFVLAGRTKDETQVGKEIPEILEKLISRKVIGRSEARAILNQMVLFPNISCRDLIISAGYVTEHELDVIIEATQSEATGQFEKLQLATQPIASHSPSRLVAPEAGSKEEQWAQAAQSSGSDEKDSLSQPASRQIQSNTGPLAAPRPPAQQSSLSAPRPPSQDKQPSAPRQPAKEAPLSAPRPPSAELARASSESENAPRAEDGESLASALSPGLLAKAMAASQPPDSLSAALSPEVLKKALIESQAASTEQPAQNASQAESSLGAQLSLEFLQRADNEAKIEAQRTSQPNLSAFMAPWPGAPAPNVPPDSAAATTSGFDAEAGLENPESTAQPPASVEDSLSKWAAPTTQAPSGAPGLSVPAQSESTKPEQLFSSPFEIWQMPKVSHDEPPAPEPAHHAQGEPFEPFSALIKHDEPPPEEPPSEPSKLFVSEESVAQYTPKSAIGHQPQAAVEPEPEPESEPIAELEKPQLAPHQRFPEPDEPERPQVDSGIIVDATPLRVPVPPQLEFSAGVAAATPAKVSPRPQAGNVSEAEKLKKFLDDEAKVKAARAKIREREAAQNEEMEKAWQREHATAAAAETPVEVAQAPSIAPAQEPAQEAPPATPDSFDDEFEDEFSSASEPAKPALKDWTQLPNVSAQPDVQSSGGSGMALLDWGDPEPIDLDSTTDLSPPPIEPAPPSIEPAPPPIEPAPSLEAQPAQVEAPAAAGFAQLAESIESDFDFPDEEFGFAEGGAPGPQGSDSKPKQETSGFEFSEPEASKSSGIEFKASTPEDEAQGGVTFNVQEDEVGISFKDEEQFAEPETSGGIDFNDATDDAAEPGLVEKTDPQPIAAPSATSGAAVAPSSEIPEVEEPAKQDSIISKPSFLTPPPSFLSQPPSFLTPPASMRSKKAEEAPKPAEAPPQPAEVSNVPPIKESVESSCAHRIEKKTTGLDEENDLALQLMMLAGLLNNEQADALEKQILSGKGDSVYELAVSSGYATSTEIAIVRRAEDLLTALSQDRKGVS